MKSACLLATLLAATTPLCSSFTFAPPNCVTQSRSMMHCAASIYMQEEGAPEEEATAKPVAPTSETASSPLAGLVGDDKLSEFQAQKEADNAKRNALRARNNVLIPAVVIGAYAIAAVIGEDNVKAFFKDFDDPLSKAPGVERGRQIKAENRAKTAEWQKSILNGGK
jgi:hypothetical protein